jgi:hypothetical protein
MEDFLERPRAVFDALGVRRISFFISQKENPWKHLVSRGFWPFC